MSDTATTRTPNKAARNERIKITAAWLNVASIAALAVGCFAPITAFVTSSAPIPIGQLNLPVAGWLAVAAGLHPASRVTLRRIEE